MRFILATLVCFGFASTTMGQPNAACQADREKFCKGIEHGDGKMMKCMKEHESELSAECKARHESIKEHLKGAKVACHDDVEKFCADVKPRRGRIMKCLKDNRDKLSESCKAEFAQPKK